MNKFWNWFYSKPIALLILLGSSGVISISFIGWIISRNDNILMTSISAAVVMTTYMAYAISYDSRRTLKFTIQSK